MPEDRDVEVISTFIQIKYLSLFAFVSLSLDRGLEVHP